MATATTTKGAVAPTTTDESELRNVTVKLDETGSVLVAAIKLNEVIASTGKDSKPVKVGARTFQGTKGGNVLIASTMFHRLTLPDHLKPGKKAVYKLTLNLVRDTHETDVLQTAQAQAQVLADGSLAQAQRESAAQDQINALTAQVAALTALMTKMAESKG